MSKTFVIADPHFGDPNIIRYENRPFQTVREMNATMIEKWNSVVKCEDTVFVLGDFAIYDDPDKIQDIRDQLYGIIILIKGNHDILPVHKYTKIGFQSAVSYPIIYDDFFILSHEPVYVNNNMPFANIYGHVHGNPTYKDASERSACVCVERIDYTPITIEKVIGAMKLASERI